MLNAGAGVPIEKGRHLIQMTPFEMSEIPINMTDYRLTTLLAWGPLGPSVMSNSTRSPSDNDLNPSP